MTTARSVKTRRIEFDRHSVPERHFAADDIFFSNLFAVLSSMFPAGEDFFVRTVRHYRNEIDDAELRRQIGGFIGQEAIHGREHDRFNELLHEHGYPTKAIDRDMERLFAIVSRTVPHNAQVAMTAFMEHFTATLGEQLLTHPDFEGMLDEELSTMLAWHALEECEHKAVAFDAMRAVDDSELTRAAGVVLTLAIVGPFLVGALARSLASDPAARNPLKLLASLRRIGDHPLFQPVIGRRLRSYARRGFHPDDHNTDQLVEQVRKDLFGKKGTLASRTKGAA